MKDTHVLIGACALALLAIVAVFIGYATDTLPHSATRVITPAMPASRTPVAKKKDCACCKVTREVLRARIKAVVNKHITEKTQPPLGSSVSGDPE